VEEELLDYGGVEDLEEIDVNPMTAIDGRDNAKTPDLQLVQASMVFAPGSVATSSSVTLVAKPNRSDDVDHHGTAEKEGGKATTSPPVDSPDLMTESRH
jgi:hypothetical protein